MSDNTKSWVVTGVVLLIIFAVICLGIYIYVRQSDDEELDEQNNIQNPSNPKSNSTLDLNKRTISTASTPNSGVKTGVHGTWFDPGGR